MRFMLIEILWGEQTLLFLVDRQFKFRMVWHFHPSEVKSYIKTNITRPLQLVNVFDGELVIDKAWRKGEANSVPIFLIFDCILVNTVNLIALPFSQRLNDTYQYIIKRFLPARQKTQNLEPRKHYVDVYMKEMFNIWDAKHLLTHFIDAGKL